RGYGADGQVQVDTGVDPQRVHGEVGHIGRNGDTQPPALAYATQDQRCERVHRDDGVRTRGDDRLPQLAAGEQAGHAHDGGPGEGLVPVDGAVRQLIGPGREPELQPVDSTEQRTDADGEHREEVDDRDVVAAAHEAALQLTRGPVVTRTHR